MLTVRQATPADRDAIAAYNAALAFESEGLRLDPATVAAGVAAALATPDVRGPYYVCEVDGAVVGQLAVTFEWSDWRNGWWWWVQSVYVSPEYRRRGVFSALHERVEADARATPGVIGVRLYVERENAAARATYDRRGFSETGYRLLEKELA